MLTDRNSEPTTLTYHGLNLDKRSIHENISNSFDNHWSSEEINQGIEEIHQSIRQQITATNFLGNSEFHQKKNQAEGVRLFNHALSTNQICSPTNFNRLLYHCSNWWQREETLVEQTAIPNLSEITKVQTAVLGKLFIPLLPPHITSQITGFTYLQGCSNYNAFILLFENPENQRFLIITNKHVFELLEVNNLYSLDIDDQNFPLVRCSHSPSKLPVFFDGIHLIKNYDHVSFEGKIELFGGGYKLNAGLTSLINGAVFPRIDNVAKDYRINHKTWTHKKILSPNLLQTRKKTLYILPSPHRPIRSLPPKPIEENSFKYLGQGPRVLIDSTEIGSIGTYVAGNQMVSKSGNLLTTWATYHSHSASKKNPSREKATETV